MKTARLPEPIHVAQGVGIGCKCACLDSSAQPSGRSRTSTVLRGLNLGVLNVLVCGRRLIDESADLSAAEKDGSTPLQVAESASPWPMRAVRRSMWSNISRRVGEFAPLRQFSSAMTPSHRTCPGGLRLVAGSRFERWI